LDGTWFLVMAKYVKLAGDARAAAFFDDDVNIVPPDAISISDSIWMEWIQSSASVIYASGVLVPYVPPAVSQSRLVEYARSKRRNVINGGVSVNVAADGMAVVVANVNTSTEGRADLAGLAHLAASNTAFTTVWVHESGDITLDAVQIMTLATCVANFVDRSYQVLSGVIAAIQSGVITTFAQIEIPPQPIPAWPSNVCSRPRTCN
jgi:hypothetical protein